MKIYNRTQKILAVICSLFFMSLYTYIPYQTPYLTSIGVGAQMVGIVVGIYGVCPILGRVPFGVLADKKCSHKRFIFVGLACGFLASAIRICSPNAIGFLIANIFSGLAICFWISFITLFIDLSPKELQPRATSDTVFFMNIGMLSAFVVSTILYKHIGMRATCGISAGCCATGFVLTFFLEEPKKEMAAVTVKELLSVLRNKRLLMYGPLGVIVLGLQSTTTMSFTSQVLADLGADSTVIGAATVIFMTVAVLTARFAGSKASRILKRSTWSILIFFLLAVYCVLVPIVGKPWIILLLQMIPGTSNGMLYSNLMVEAMMEVPEHQHATGMGFYQACMAVGLCIFPMFSGRIAEQTGSMTPAFFVLAGICLVGLVLVAINGKLFDRTAVRTE